ncbi:MAG: SurA N-terminal domain-containing protein, partial [Gammaproteobacteria bacterium]|nr:SurA N-terminal domain-containing protein [Gammaproteobacteria bacterium]
EISTRQEDAAYQNLRNRLEDTMGSTLDPDMINEAQLRKSALGQLINEELLFQEAFGGGFAASDQQLAAQISSMRVFKSNGKFSKQRYELALSNQGMTPSEFEGQLRRNIMSAQFRSGIVKTAAPTTEELELAYRLQGQQRRFSYLILPVSGFNDLVKIEAPDVEQYYETHGQEYMSPERVKVQYLELEAAKLKVGAEPSEAELRSLYNEESGRFTTGEERHARHILVTFQGTDEESIGKTTSKAAEIVKRLDAGEAFDAVAREASEDPGSASSGGDLGFFGRGIMAAEFEKAVFDMQVGDRSEPVRSSYGLHIIELLGIKPETVKPFEDVRESLADQLLSEERGDLFFEQAEVLANLAFEHPDTLQEAASVLGLQIRESDWISADEGPGIGEHAVVVEAAFSEDVLLGGNNSNTVEVDEDHILVLRVSDHQKPAQKSFEDVGDIIRQRLQDERARALAKAKGEELLVSLQAGVALEKIASEQTLEAGQTELLGRNASTPQKSLVQKVFSLATPGDGQIIADGFVMSNGNYALVLLEEVNEGQFDTLDASTRMQLRQELGKVQGQVGMVAAMAALDEKATIHIP